MVGVMVHVKGLDELQKALTQLPIKLETNIMRGAMRAGAVVVQKQAKINAPLKSGILAAGIKVSTRSRNGQVSATVKTTGKHAYIAPWIEFGVAAHKILPRRAKALFFLGRFVKVIMHPGFGPKPFMRPAVEARAQDALMAAGLYIRARLVKSGVDGAAGITLEREE